MRSRDSDLPNEVPAGECDEEDEYDEEDECDEDVDDDEEEKDEFEEEFEEIEDDLTDLLDVDPYYYAEVKAYLIQSALDEEGE